MKPRLQKVYVIMRRISLRDGHGAEKMVAIFSNRNRASAKAKMFDFEWWAGLQPGERVSHYVKEEHVI